MSNPFSNNFDHFVFQNDPVTHWFNECRFYLTESDTQFDNPQFFMALGLKVSSQTLDEWIELAHPDDRSLLDTTLHWHKKLQLNYPLVSHYRIKNRDGFYINIEQKLVALELNGMPVIMGRLSICENHTYDNISLEYRPIRHSISGLYTQTKLLIDIKNIQETDNNNLTVAHIKVDNLTNQVRQFGPELLLDVARKLHATCKIFLGYRVHLYQLDTDTFMLLLVGNIDFKLLEPLFASFISKYISINEGLGSLYADKISIGIVPNNDNQFSGEELLDLSTQTRRYANHRKNNHIAIYSEVTKEKVARFSYIEKNLAKAVRQRQLSVNFHPIVDLKNQQVASFESLVRWNCQEYGQIGPIEFIHIAEKQGLIYDLGILVFQSACTFLQQYNKKHGSQVKVNINVSVLQLLNRDLPSHFRRIALQYGLTPNSIVLEITETVNLDDNNHALAQLRKLSDMGFILSLDDFGAGMTSINSFFDFPFKQIKIDRSFALRAMVDSSPTHFLQFLIRLCRNKAISIVVEGVETHEMLDFYLKLGTTHLQGYFYSMPLPVEEAMLFVPEINQ
jgi:EAL domain-containing protein (putative c-di-GMP-specific phosphodiesterase class I)/GGDEF domain-containing protein